MSKSKRKRVLKTVLTLPGLEQSKSAVLNSLASASSKRSYDHAICEIHRLVLLGTSPRVPPGYGAPAPVSHSDFRMSSYVAHLVLQ
jgi:hypothetical protein